ncbi:MAG: hypothetical protein V4724_39485 [Pseudomonadota bacterium]
MKIQSLYFKLENALVKDELTVDPPQEKLMRPLSKIEVETVAGGPEVENEPPPN